MRIAPSQIRTAPCKNCISFPMCNSEFMSGEQSYDSLVYMPYTSKCQFISYIWKKCDTAKDFISNSNPIYAEHGSWIIYEYFRGYNMDKGNIR